MIINSYTNGLSRRFITVLVVIMLLGFSAPVISQNNSLLVFYPEAPPPYHDAFMQTLDGIKTSNSNILSLAIPPNYNPKDIRAWLDANKAGASYLIALGTRALRASNELNHNLKVIYGLLDHSSAKNQPVGISINIHPSLYLEFIKKTSADINSIVFFHGKDELLYATTAVKEGGKYGVKVRPILITDLENAVLNVSNAFKTKNPKRTALWFSNNVLELNTELLFPYVLESSWEKKFITFSNMISHTKRGMLFSLYPDYHEVGIELGKLAGRNVFNNTIYHLYILSAKVAFNTRTARHLRLKVDASILESVDINFPAR